MIAIFSYELDLGETPDKKKLELFGLPIVNEFMELTVEDKKKYAKGVMSQSKKDIKEVLAEISNANLSVD